jgi:hypothetical protein
MPHAIRRFICAAIAAAALGPESAAAQAFAAECGLKLTLT